MQAFVQLVLKAVPWLQRLRTLPERNWQGWMSWGGTLDSRPYLQQPGAWLCSEDKPTRIIECRDGIQWIIQNRSGTRDGQPLWRSRSYCRTRKGLEGLLPGKAEEIRAALPERFPEA